MNYAANVSGGANQHYPVAGASTGVGGYNTVGAILVLFILLVIIIRVVCCSY
ncbi:hypothetical protein M6D81_22470 [Paenibacillus sp. J5C_2022]|uniref:hypothetical protein n=1 Tax=Paenibacillus sp. J5C2022 TaxID=2977129 RepID=UPI0021D35E16|nr:hypothetical protein [Paenibacillus sp. J5C2022]MCU6711465.1 hypothetical protein [Paenibacillus sp. J5C2022]